MHCCGKLRKADIMRVVTLIQVVENRKAYLILSIIEYSSNGRYNKRKR